jgi:excisionase family DNA binding protein
MLTIKELSAWLNIKPSTLYLWVSQNKIPCHRIHGLIRFDPDAIQAWLNGFELNSRPRPSHCRFTTSPEILISSLKLQNREVYTPRHGETRPKSGLIQKEDADGAV